MSDISGNHHNKEKMCCSITLKRDSNKQEQKEKSRRRFSRVELNWLEIKTLKTLKWHITFFSGNEK